MCARGGTSAERRLRRIPLRVEHDHRAPLPAQVLGDASRRGSSTCPGRRCPAPPRSGGAAPSWIDTGPSASRSVPCPTRLTSRRRRRERQRAAREGHRRELHARELPQARRARRGEKTSRERPGSGFPSPALQPAAEQAEPALAHAASRARPSGSPRAGLAARRRSARRPPALGEHPHVGEEQRAMLDLEAAEQLRPLQERSLERDLPLAATEQSPRQSFDGGRRRGQRELHEGGSRAGRHRAQHAVHRRLRFALEAPRRRGAADEAGVLLQPQQHRRRLGPPCLPLLDEAHVGVRRLHRGTRRRGPCRRAAEREPCSPCSRRVHASSAAEGCPRSRRRHHRSTSAACSAGVHARERLGAGVVGAIRDDAAGGRICAGAWRSMRVAVRRCAGRRRGECRGEQRGAEPSRGARRRRAAGRSGAPGCAARSARGARDRASPRGCATRNRTASRAATSAATRQRIAAHGHGSDERRADVTCDAPLRAQQSISPVSLKRSTRLRAPRCPGS